MMMMMMWLILTYPMVTRMFLAASSSLVSTFTSPAMSRSVEMADPLKAV